MACPQSRMQRRAAGSMPAQAYQMAHRRQTCCRRPPYAALRQVELHSRYLRWPLLPRSLHGPAQPVTSRFRTGTDACGIEKQALQRREECQLRHSKAGISPRAWEAAGVVGTARDESSPSPYTVSSSGSSDSPTPCTANTLLARSSPTVIMLMDLPLR